MINSVFRHGFVINLGIGLLLMIVLLLCLPLLYHMDQPKEIIPDTIGFLGIMTLSILPFMVFQTLREVSEGLSYTLGVTKATIIANVINIILNYVLFNLMFGFGNMVVYG